MEDRGGRMKYENDVLAKKLLIIQRKHDMTIRKIEAVLGEIGNGGNCELTEIFPLDLHEIALDLLGVPIDLTAEHKEGFCRDWLFDEWYYFEINPDQALVDDDIDEYVESYIIFVKKEMLEFKTNYLN